MYINKLNKALALLVYLLTAVELVITFSILIEIKVRNKPKCITDFA